MHMNLRLFPTLKNYNLRNLPGDIFSGIIIAAVSIPISMGYAQISGIPAIYGLYGSVFPILFFALFSTSKQFIFGVDAAPAAIVGSALASLGIAAESPDALACVPVIAFFAGLWLLIFYFLHADRIVDFISTPVMGGFISGISLTIILMQIPKLMGRDAGSGELPELLHYIFLAARSISLLSLAMGISALILIRIGKKIFPKVPMSIVIMILGVLSTTCFHVQNHGVVLLQAVEPGFPTFLIPKFGEVALTQTVGRGLMVAVVIMAETLLAENNFAFKNGYKLNDRQEILACAAGNISASFVGCCPLLQEFDLSQEHGHIINGHVPVHQGEGESPVKCNGKVIVIDGGFCKAYQKVTGIAGYTLIYNSYGLILSAHEPFTSKEDAVSKESDIVSNRVSVHYTSKRRLVGDTDTGKALRERIEELMQLLDAYRKGYIKEKK